MPKQSDMPLPEPYSAEAAIEHIQRILKAMPSRAWRLTIHKTNPGGLTAHQTTEVKSMSAGFDWQAGQIIIEPARPLTELSPEQVEAIVTSVRKGSSWHAYEREKKLRERIKELEARDAAWASRLEAAESRVAELEKDAAWRSAVDSALVNSGLDCLGPEDTPGDALKRLIEWNVQVALDPSVSIEAAALATHAFIPKEGRPDWCQACDYHRLNPRHP